MSSAIQPQAVIDFLNFFEELAEQEDFNLIRHLISERPTPVIYD